MPRLTAGQNVRSTYTVERLLGEGAFAEVYRVQHRFLGRQAMKVLKAPGAGSTEIEQIVGEALLLSRIGHPNIIRVFDANVLDIQGETYGFFTMEYVPGGSLDAFWRSYRDRLMPIAQAVDVIKQVCLGVAVAHAESPPVVHRDIKPQNILVGYDANGLRVRVADFGLAKRVNPLTLLVSSRGTLQFKAPESFDNHESPAADVWAIGTTLYLLLADVLPFPELDGRDVTDASRFLRGLRPASVYNISVDAALDTILSRCLAPNASDRYSSARDLLNDLQRWHPNSGQSQSMTSASTAHSKAALGTAAAVTARTPREMASKALELAKSPASLTLAADMLEEALSRSPPLRDEYESQLRLWRRGVCM